MKSKSTIQVNSVIQLFEVTNLYYSQFVIHHSLITSLTHYKLHIKIDEIWLITHLLSFKPLSAVFWNKHQPSNLTPMLSHTYQTPPLKKNNPRFACIPGTTLNSLNPLKYPAPPKISLNVVNFSAFSGVYLSVLSTLSVTPPASVIYNSSK